MECKWDSCKNEARVRSPFCSGTCKKRAQRHAEQTSGTFVPVEVGHALSGTQVEQIREQAAKGLAIDKIVWIKDTLTNTGVEESGKVKQKVDIERMHRVISDGMRSICCGPDKGGQPEPILTPSMLATLPVGVTRPTGQPNERTKAMTGENLNRRLIGVKVWQGGPEYAEVVHRLLTGKTEGMNLPGWAVA